MNWMLVVIFVSVASGDKALSTTTIDMESEKICTEAKDKLKKSCQTRGLASVAKRAAQRKNDRSGFDA